MGQVRKPKEARGLVRKKHIFLRRKPKERKEPAGKHAPAKELTKKGKTLLEKEPR
jgi:hypothetical protein